jgi:hypothetical protein
MSFACSLFTALSSTAEVYLSRCGTTLLLAIVVFVDANLYIVVFSSLFSPLSLFLSFFSLFPLFHLLRVTPYEKSCHRIPHSSSSSSSSRRDDLWIVRTAKRRY